MAGCDLPLQDQLRPCIPPAITANMIIVKTTAQNSNRPRCSSTDRFDSGRRSNSLDAESPHLVTGGWWRQAVSGGAPGSAPP
jgi:hypothetical protein